MKVITRRALLRPSSGEEDVAAFASGRGGRRVGEERLDAMRWQRKTTWDLPGLRSLWFVEDTAAGCAYVQVSGAEAASAESLLQEVEHEFGACRRSELLEEVEKAEDSRSLGVATVRLAMIAGDRFDEEVHEVISSEFYNEHAVVRELAVWASFYARCPEYLPDLEEVLENDSSGDVRDRARMVINLYDELGIV